LELVAGHSHRRNRRWVTVAAAVAAAVVFAAVAAVVTNAARTQEPAAQVRAFFAALTSRDGDQLRNLTGCDASPLCTAPALRSGYQPPQQATIDTTGAGRQPDPDHRALLVRYRLAGHEYAEEVGLTRYRDGFLGHSWIITEAPGIRLHVHS